MKKNVNAKRKKILLFGSIGCILMTLYCLQKPIMMWSVKQIISSSFAKEGRALTYKKAEVRNGCLVFSQMALKQGTNLFSLNELRVKPKIDLRRFALKMEMTLLEPNLQLNAEGDFQFARLLKALKPHSGCYLKLDTERGILDLEGHPFYFSITGGKEKFDLGTFSLFLDPNLIKEPFLVAQLKQSGKELTAELKMQEVQTDQMLKLFRMAGLSFANHWQGVHGVASLQGKATLTSAGIIKTGGVEFSFDQIECLHTKEPLIFKSQHLGGSVQLDPLGFPQWKRIGASVSLEKAHIELKDRFAFTEISGRLHLDPQEEPSMHLNGLLAQLNSSRFDSFQGESLISMSGEDSPWKLPPAELDPRRSKEKKQFWRALPFSFEGKGGRRKDQTCWLDCLMQFAQGPQSSQISFSLGSLRSDEFLLNIEAKQCSGEALAILQAMFTKPVEILEGVCEGKAHVCFCKGLPTKIEIEQLQGYNCLLRVEENEPLLLEAITISGTVQNSIAQLEVTLDLPKEERINATIKTSGNQYEICGLFHGIEETNIQFGCTSSAPFPVHFSDLSEGWLRSDSVGSAFYLPLAKRLDPYLDLQGAFDVFGVFNGKEVEISVQCEDLHVRSPLFVMESPRVGQRDPMLLKTKGRAKLLYSLEKEEFDIEVPLRCATFYDTSTGLFIQELDADLRYTPERGFSVDLQRGLLSYDNKPLLQEVAAHIEGASLESFKVVDLKGKVGGTQIKASEVIFEDGFSSLKAEIDGILKIDIERQGKNLNVHGLIGTDELQAVVQYDMKKETARVQELLLKGAKGSLQAEGELALDFCDPDLPLSIRAELSFLVKIGALEFKTIRRAKIAFAPALGIEVSDLTLQSQDMQIAVEQLEMLFPKEKLIARGCRFGRLPCVGLYELDKENFSLILRDSKGELLLKGKCDGILLERVEGALNGLTCKLRQKSPNKLKGSMEVDTSVWAVYLPETWQKLPKGNFVLNGDFSFAPMLRFAGQLSTPAGSATVEVTPDAIECSDLLMNDPSGQFAASKASLRYISEKEAWYYTVPFAQLSQVKVTVLPGVSLSKAVVRDLQGFLGNLDTVTANGSFSFRAKPGAFMKKFNLDPALGSPVTGEVDYEVQKGKCTIVALRDVFTDKKRAQFSLSKQASASFDFRGNLFFDLLVKANDANNRNRKFISLSVRGTLNQPAISVH